MGLLMGFRERVQVKSSAWCLLVLYLQVKVLAVCRRAFTDVQGACPALGVGLFLAPGQDTSVHSSPYAQGLHTQYTH